MKKRTISFAILLMVCIVLFVMSYYNSRQICTIIEYGDDSWNQGMFYTIEDASGHFIVIDGGWPEQEQYVRDIIAQHNNHVDAWIITHTHQDHVGAFNNIYSNLAGIEIDAIYTGDVDVNQFYQRYTPDDHIEQFEMFQKIISDNDKVHYLHKGDDLQIGDIDIQVFNAYNDDFKTYDFRYNLPNASSLVFKVSYGDSSMLFLADCEASMESYMDVKDMKADYVQMAHHGQNMSDEFYEEIGAETYFVDGPAWLRESDTFNVKERVEKLRAEGKTVLSYDTAPNEIVLR